MSPRKAAASGETSTCPWCSATVPVEAATCPSCGASLRDAADGEILGVTHIDPTVVMKSKRIKSRPLASWLSGDTTSSDDDSGGKVEPPSDAVRKEMLRLELAAIDAEIEAKRAAAEAQRALPPDTDTTKPA
jgi:hypothetical protein